MERKTLLWIGAGIVALGLFAPLGMKVKKAAAQDPAFCLSCHQMDGPYLAWATSPHAEITCVKCHPGTLATDLRHAWLAVVMQVETIEGEVLVDEGACVGCHVEGNDPDWPAVGATSGHRAHDGRIADRCISCHGSTEHIERPATEVCETCHGQEMTLSAMVGQVHCLDCHNFLREGDDLEPTADICRACHTAPDTAHEVRAHATEDCLACHGPHDDETTEPVPCLSCHEDIAPEHAPHEAACESCHLAHEPAAEAVDQCAECHTYRKGLHARRSHRACLTCHQPHQDVRPDASVCVDCHSDLLDTHASRGCIGCHPFRKDLPEPTEPDPGPGSPAGPAPR